MGPRKSDLKRKNSLSKIQELDKSSETDEEPNVEQNDSEEGDLLKSINNENDSSDSEREPEESDGEYFDLDDLPEYNSDLEEVSDQEDEEDDDLEDSDEENESDDEHEESEEENGEASDEESSDEDNRNESVNNKSAVKNKKAVNGKNVLKDLKKQNKNSDLYNGSTKNKSKEIGGTENLKKKLVLTKKDTAKPDKTPKTLEKLKTKKSATKVNKKQQNEENSDYQEKEPEASTSKPEVSKPVDEYEYDTSDEEDIRNTVGNVPKHWYDEYPHLGYDWDGKKILKPKTGDQLDQFLQKIEDPDFWKTVKDPQTGQDVVLNNEDIEIIRRIQAGKIPDVSFDQYAPWIDWFTSEVMKTPIRKFPEHKRSFLPSRSEAKKVSRLVHALKMGWIKTREEARKAREKPEPKFYMLWQTDNEKEEMRRIHNHIPAPKRGLPGHAESYNPPAEYLFDELEMKEWRRMKDRPGQRKLHFLPQKYKSLREVPAYSRYIRERFLRCLDLYLCPRAVKLRLNIEPEALLPKLPSPRDLQPFPTTVAVNYIGHTDMIRTLSCDPKGQYLISGSDDQTVKIWEVNTGRCLRTIEVENVVQRVAWCPNLALSLVAIAAGQTLYLINPKVGDQLVVSKTDKILQDFMPPDIIVADRVRTTVRWESAEGPEWDTKCIRVKVQHFQVVTQVTWHGQGDYFASVMPDGQNRSVLIHQLSKRRSQLPFTKSKGRVQCVLFHPVRPFLFVATQSHVRIYDLVKQEMVKKLMTNSRWISSMAIHPGGDNLLVGTYDRKMLWFDLDLSTKPYQTLRLHGTAVRGVAYHKRYPLFASASDDKSVIICHGMVYSDLLQNPLIVPVKKLQFHRKYNDFGVFDVLFHPSQPWLFSAGADSTAKLYS